MKFTFIFLAALFSSLAFSTPQIIRVDGSIYDNLGNPLTGTPTITVAAYSAASGGTALWGPSSYTPNANNGQFTIDLNASSGAPSLTQVIANTASGQSVWFELSYGGNIVRPRIRARGSLFAVAAANADSIRTIAVSTTAPSTNYALSYNGASWAPTSVTGLVTGAYVYRAGDTMTGALWLPGLTLSSASMNVSSLSATRLVRTDANMNLVSVTANVADSDLANIAGTTANIQAQLNAMISAAGAGGSNLVSLSPALTITGGTGAVLGLGAQISLSTASATTTGLILASDWLSFNSRLSVGAQNANLILAGPTGGVAAAPSFRALVPQDLGSGSPTGGLFLRGDGTWAPMPGVPAGSIEAWGGTTLPVGWLWCDGSSYLQASYPDLFAVIGTNYGSADGQHFNVPDLRGRFIRGTDNYGAGAAGNDPDAAARAASNLGGATGNVVGSLQADQIASHSHSLPNAAWASGGGAYYIGNQNAYPGNVGGTVTSAAGGNETRPKNVYVNYIIKYTQGSGSGSVLASDLNGYVPLAGGSVSGTLNAATVNISSLGPAGVVLTDANSNLISLAPGVTSNVLTSNGSAWTAAQPLYFGVNCGTGNALAGFTGTGSPVCVTAASITTPVFTKVTGGGYYGMCGLLSDGTVMCWGYNGAGQLGNNTATSQSVPGLVRNVDGSKLSGVVDIGEGYQSVCAAKSDGTVWCWGYNNYGQLGNGTTTNSYYPVQVTGLSGATKVAASYYSACALKSNNTVSCWGYDANGELGNGANTTSPTPVAVSGVTTAVSISGGSSHYCSLLSTGNAVCWGYNGYGQLGNNSTTSSNVPVAVSGVTNVSQISTGADYNSEDHTCAVETNGTVWCWGLGGNGQLGNGAAANSNVPVQVSGITTAVNVAAGGLSSCVAKADTSVWCFGYNNYGYIGDGTTTQRNSPVQVVGVGGTGTLSGISQVAISPDFSGSWAAAAAALTTTGQIMIWGYNGYGQLGNNTTTTSYTPVGAWYP